MSAIFWLTEVETEYSGPAVIHISLRLARSSAVVIRRTIWFTSWKLEVLGLDVGCDTDYPD